jgi:tetratricopeptide (TPR) repeat protein
MTLESRAKAYVKTNHAELAIIDCNDCLLMLQHSVPEVNAIRADAFEMSGRAKQALADYQVVIKQKADVDESLKAETSPEKRGYLSALSRSLRPTLIHALKQGALVADKLSDAPTAITYYSQLILMNAGENEYYLRRAKVYEKSKQYDKAQADLDKYIAHEPKDAVAYDLRARIKAEQGRYALAIDDYTTAIKAAPEDAEFLLDKRAALYEKMGRKDQASQDRLEIQKIRTKH